MTAPSAYGDDVTLIGTTGALRYAPKSSPFPAAMAAWTAPFIDGGWISDDGITESRDTETETFTPWQANSPIRVATTSETITFELTLWSHTRDNIGLFYKVADADFDDTDPDIVSIVDGDVKGQDLRAFGIDVIDGPFERRIEIPLGEITERGDVQYTKSQLIVMPITITAYPTAAGWSVKRYFKEAWTAA